MWIRKRHLYGMLSLLVLAVALPAGSQIPNSSPLPKPEAAAQQANQLSPEELTKIEIDEVTRDRLRFDPDWQPILQAIRQDLMTVKWGDGKLQNPAWKQYGAKAYPLLSYYARSGDETRQRYAMVGIRSLGKPYTTLWLTQQIQRKLSRPDFYLLTENPNALLSNAYEQNYDPKTWEREFGLDDPKVRSQLIRLAQQNLEPQNSPLYYDQFNLAFLTTLLGYDQVYPRQPSPYDPKPVPKLPGWSQYERLTQPTASQIQAAIATYRNLPTASQEYILVERLGKVKAGKLLPIGKALLQNLATDPKAPDRMWAIAELDRHGDSQGSALLQQILNGDLSQLDPLTRPAGYEDYSDRGTHAYYLLVGITQKYPNSKFVQACKEYGDLTGRSYFGGAERSKAITVRNAKKTAAERKQDWQQWLNRYPDHPGADDATYFLARSLQDQNDVLGAMRLWMRMMIQPMGDRDASYLAWGHVRTLLDVGLTPEQLQTLREDSEFAAIAPLLQYAQAVHYARSQDYTKALQTSQQLDLTQMPTSVLGSYYSSSLWTWWAGADKPIELQQQMQAMLTDQRQRWQQLQHWQPENTPASRYQLASNWAGIDGWKNGYLPIWTEGRIYLLPTGSWGDDFCQIYWTCNLKLRDTSAVRSQYQQSSQNAVALLLYQAVLDDDRTPAPLREKTLYMTAETLLHQWENYPWGETVRIHPPTGVSTGNRPLPDDASYDAFQATEKRLQRDYQTRIDGIITELQVKFPQSQYTDDLLFSNYFLSGQPRYLKQLIERYPQSDRATEAKYLLDHPISQSN